SADSSWPGPIGGQASEVNALPVCRGRTLIRFESAEVVRPLTIRIAKRLNRVMGRRGAVFADRYHAHVLRTPSEVARALAHVFGNFAVHARRRGDYSADAELDPYS